MIAYAITLESSSTGGGTDRDDFFFTLFDMIRRANTLVLRRRTEQLENAHCSETTTPSPSKRTFKPPAAPLSIITLSTD